MYQQFVKQAALAKVATLVSVTRLESDPQMLSHLWATLNLMKIPLKSHKRECEIWIGLRKKSNLRVKCFFLALWLFEITSIEMLVTSLKFAMDMEFWWKMCYAMVRKCIFGMKLTEFVRDIKKNVFIKGLLIKSGCHRNEKAVFVRVWKLVNQDG